MVVPGGGGDATSGENVGSETVGGGEATTTGGSVGKRSGGVWRRRNGLDMKGLLLEEIGEKGH